MLEQKVRIEGLRFGYLLHCHLQCVCGRKQNCTKVRKHISRSHHMRQHHRKLESGQYLQRRTGRSANFGKREFLNPGSVTTIAMISIVIFNQASKFFRRDFLFDLPSFTHSCGGAGGAVLQMRPKPAAVMLCQLRGWVGGSNSALGQKVALCSKQQPPRSQHYACALDLRSD